MQVTLGISILKQSIFAQTKNREKCLRWRHGSHKAFWRKCIWLASNITSYARPALNTGKDFFLLLKHKITISKEQLFISHIYIYIYKFIYEYAFIWASLVAQMIKGFACNACRDPGLIPQSGISPGEGNGYQLQYYCLENSMNREVWWATVHGVAKSQTWLSDNTFTFYIYLYIYMIYIMHT